MLAATLRTTARPARVLRHTRGLAVPARNVASSPSAPPVQTYPGKAVVQSLVAQHGTNFDALLSSLPSAVRLHKVASSPEYFEALASDVLPRGFLSVSRVEKLAKSVGVDPDAPAAVWLAAAERATGWRTGPHVSGGGILGRELSEKEVEEVGKVYERAVTAFARTAASRSSESEGNWERQHLLSLLHALSRFALLPSRDTLIRTVVDASSSITSTTHLSRPESGVVLSKSHEEALSFYSETRSPSLFKLIANLSLADTLVLPPSLAVTPFAPSSRAAYRAESAQRLVKAARLVWWTNLLPVSRVLRGVSFEKDAEYVGGVQKQIAAWTEEMKKEFGPLLGEGEGLEGNVAFKHLEKMGGEQEWNQWFWNQVGQPVATQRAST